MESSPGVVDLAARPRSEIHVHDTPLAVRARCGRSRLTVGDLRLAVGDWRRAMSTSAASRLARLVAVTCVGADAGRPEISNVCLYTLIGVVRRQQMDPSLRLISACSRKKFLLRRWESSLLAAGSSWPQHDRTRLASRLQYSSASASEGPVSCPHAARVHHRCCLSSLLVMCCWVR